MQSIEEWRALSDFPFYEISSHGRVRSKTHSWSRPNPTGVGLPQTITWEGRLVNGYIKRYRGRPVVVGVSLRKDNTTHYERVHRLVLVTFVGPCPLGMEGCHNDGDPVNNHLTNLRWDTHQANMTDCMRHGSKVNPPRYVGETHPNARLTTAQVKAIRQYGTYRGSGAALAVKYGVTQTTIGRIRAWKQRASRDEYRQSDTRGPDHRA